MNTLRHSAPYGHTSPGEPFTAEQVYPAAAESLAGGRVFLADTLAAWQLGAAAVDAGLVAGELLANAVTAGAQAVPPEILLRLTLTPGFVVIQAGDHDRAAPPQPRPVGWQAERGRGLLIVATLADQLGWCTLGPWKIVWATVPVAAPPMAVSLSGGPLESAA